MYSSKNVFVVVVGIQAPDYRSNKQPSKKRAYSFLLKLLIVTKKQLPLIKLKMFNCI